MVTLDLGCGNNKEKDSSGYDIANLPGVDVIRDLSKDPSLREYKDNSVDKIIMRDFIEHLDDPIPLLKECWRVLKGMGILFITVVYWSHRYSYSDPQHKRAFSERWFEYLVNNKGRDWYFDFHFSTIYIHKIFDGKAILKVIGKDIASDLLTIEQRTLMDESAYFNINTLQALYITLTK